VLWALILPPAPLKSGRRRATARAEAEGGLGQGPLDRSAAWYSPSPRRMDRLGDQQVPGRGRASSSRQTRAASPAVAGAGSSGLSATTSSPPPRNLLGVFPEAGLPIAAARAVSLREEREHPCELTVRGKLAQPDVRHAGEGDHHGHAGFAEAEQVEALDLGSEGAAADVLDGPDALAGVKPPFPRAGRSCVG